MTIFAGNLSFAKNQLISTMKNSNLRLLISLGACSDSVNVDFFLSEKCQSRIVEFCREDSFAFINCFLSNQEN